MEKSATSLNTLDIGERLKIARHHLGFSQQILAEKIQSSKTGIQANEAGRSVPGGAVLLGFIGLGISVDWILSGEGEMLLTGKPTASSSDDLQLYVESMEVINFLIEKAGKTATYKQRRALVDALYQASKPAGKVDETTAALILKVAA